MTTIVLTKHDPDFERFYWVTQAVPRKNAPDSPILKTLCVTPTQIEATDGDRMHSCEYLGQYETGLYTVTNRTKTKILLEKSNLPIDEFPHVLELCLPKEKAKTVMHVKYGYDTPRYSLCALYGHGYQIAKILQAPDFDLAININYLQDILDAGLALTASMWGSTDPILFKGSAWELRALVMPLLPAWYALCP
jgi:hypothetical protein